jgi:hypothetical protein
VADLRPAEQRLADLLEGADITRIDMDTIRVDIDLEFAHGLADDLDRLAAAKEALERVRALLAVWHTFPDGDRVGRYVAEVRLAIDGPDRARLAAGSDQ